MKLSTFISVCAFTLGAAAHSLTLSPSLLKRHSDLSKRCAGGVANLNQKRYEKRNYLKQVLAKRDLGENGNTTYQITTEAPYYDVIQNDTCVLSPDVTSGPYYWPRSQTLRQDMREKQDGIPLVLDIGILDMATCEPLPDALVSLWHCNATGSYSSFTGRDPNTDLSILLQQMNMSVSDFVIGETDVHTDDTTWLRGMWPSSKEGLLEMKTIYPGFYTGRAIHIHVQVFTDYVLHSNGTVRTGNLNSVGQLYFSESISEQIMMIEPYASHTQINRTLNSEDSVLPQNMVGGYNPIVDIVPLDGDDISKGMIGYITIGVDTEADPGVGSI